ncbi:MAG: hypothetical protein IPK99_12630 [Flavobacteriales bacterium]|nr:hypothetical protein [Flavobacteriales bacterium]
MDRTTRTVWLPLLVATLAFGGVWRAVRVAPAPPGLHVVLEVTTTYDDTYTLFYDDLTYVYDPSRQIQHEVVAAHERQRIHFDLPEGIARVQGLRLDPSTAGTQQLLHAIVLEGPYRTVRLTPERILELFAPTNQLEPFRIDSVREAIVLEATGQDPYMSTTRDIAPIVQEALDPVRPVIGPFLIAFVVSVLLFFVLQLILRPRKPRPIDVAPAQRGVPIPRKRKLIAAAISLVAALLTFGFVHAIHFRDRAVHVELELVATQGDNFQMFHAARTGDFKEGYFVNASLRGSPRPQLVDFRMPADTAFGFLRFDPGDQQDSLLIRRMVLRCNDERTVYGPQELFDLFHVNEQVRTYEVAGQGLRMVFSGNDPFLFSDTDMRTRLEDLQARSGNGPMPLAFALIVGFFAFTSLVQQPRLDHARGTATGHQVALVIAFVGLLWAPLLADWLPIEPYLEDTEKRPMAEKPLARMHSIERFPALYTKFFSDHFGFRKALFRANAMFYTYVLRSSPLPGNVVFGKDGYLFLMRDGVVDQYRGLPIFTNNELDLIAARLEARRKWLAERGIAYYITVAPMASTIYPDKLPDRFRSLHRQGGLDQLIHHLAAHTSVQLVDMREPLRAAREVRDTYYTTDIHWNPWGAFVGYRTLMERIAKDHPEVGAPCLAEDYVVELDTNDQGTWRCNWP